MDILIFVLGMLSGWVAVEMWNRKNRELNTRGSESAGHENPAGETTDSPAY